MHGVYGWYMHNTIIIIIIMHFHSIQKHEKSLQFKRQELEQWEKDVLGGGGGYNGLITAVYVTSS